MTKNRRGSFYQGLTIYIAGEGDNLEETAKNSLFRKAHYLLSTFS
jgi:hypothetical protein